MTDWRLAADPDQEREDLWSRLPTPLMSRVTGPENYIPHEALLDAINTALALGQPLLVTGDPGCGKTELGDFIAWKLGLGRAIRYDTKSNMQVRDLFYTFDTVARFSAAQSSAPDGSSRTDPVHFIRYHALGEAIIRAAEPERYTHLLPPDFKHEHQSRSVVLIDEIDKAPRDVPNDLLAELETMRFTIPELDYQVVTADEAFRPILVLTSNSEKSLPEAFLRRCVYYDIPFPSSTDLKTIVENRISDLPRDASLVSDTIAIMTHLRRARSLRKPPGTAELLGFILALRDRGYTPEQRLGDDKQWTKLARVTLFKTREDQDRAESHLQGVDWKATARS